MNGPRIQIGSQYVGPAFDRPCIRQLPRHWTLETDKPEPWILSGATWISIALVLAWLFAVVQIVREIL